MATPRDHLVRGTSHKLIGIVVKSASPLLTILLAHFFSQDAFGQYVSLQLLTLTLSRFSLFGLDKGIVWRLPRNVREQRDPFDQLGAAFASVLKTALAITAGAFLVSSLLLRWSPGALGDVSPLFAYSCLAAIPFLATLQYFAAALEGIYRPGYRVWIGEFLLYAATPVLAIVLQAGGAGRVALPAAFLTSSVLAALAMLVVARRHFRPASMTPRGRVAGELKRYAWPQGVTDLVSSLLLRIDLWMVLFFLGPRASAVYAIMLTLSNGVKTIRQSFDSLLLPVISGMSRETQQVKLKPAFGFTVGIVSMIQYFIALAVFFFPGEVLSVAGRDYAVAPRALLLLLVGNLITGFFGLNAQVLAGLGRSAALMNLNLAVLVVNTGLNVLWIPRYGLEGAAAATVTAYLLQNVCFYVLQRRASGIQLYTRILWIQFVLILSFGAAAFALFPLVAGAGPAHRAAGFALAAAAYGLFALRLRRRTALKPDF